MKAVEEAQARYYEGTKTRCEISRASMDTAHGKPQEGIAQAWYPGVYDPGEAMLSHSPCTRMVSLARRDSAAFARDAYGGSEALRSRWLSWQGWRGSGASDGHQQ